MNKINLQNPSEIYNIASKLNRDGFIAISNFLDEKNFQIIENEVQSINSLQVTKGDKVGSYPVSAKSKIINLLKLNFNKIKQSIILEKIAKKLNLSQIAQGFFKSDVKLHMVDSYYSPKSEKNVIDWHSDMTFDLKKKYDKNSASLKFFFYLSDVQSNNGCLAYIPYSNFVTKAVAELILKKKIEPTPYWHLIELRKMIKSNNNLKLISDIVGEKIINDFLVNSEFIETNKKDTHEFDLEMNKGSVVIFDEFGIHRGAMPSKTPRLVIRYLYKKYN